MVGPLAVSHAQYHHRLHAGISANDFNFYEELNAVVQNEPADWVDADTVGLYASIGIRKGQPFAPEAPAGHEKNWVQTVPDKGYSVLLRLYGPLEPWFNQTWRPGDLEPER